MGRRKVWGGGKGLLSFCLWKQETELSGIQEMQRLKEK